MNSRTTEIFSARKPAILSESKAIGVEPVTPKRISCEVTKQLDQLGPSSEGRMLVSN
jgi:hypothetical protein